MAARSLSSRSGGTAVTPGPRIGDQGRSGDAPHQTCHTYAALLPPGCGNRRGLGAPHRSMRQTVRQRRKHSHTYLWLWPSRCPDATTIRSWLKVNQKMPTHVLARQPIHDGAAQISRDSVYRLS